MEHFRAGDKAVFSGVYKAIHDKDHVPPHYVTAIYGEIFRTECNAQTGSGLKLHYLLFTYMRTRSLDVTTGDHFAILVG